jgi:hypothetical protein
MANRGHRAAVFCNFNFQWVLKRHGKPGRPESAAIFNSPAATDRQIASGLHAVVCPGHDGDVSLLRLALLVYNREMILDTPASTFLEAFANGLRFDLRLVVYVCVPLLLALFSARAMAARGFFRSG